MVTAAVIMAAGVGSRLRGHYNSCPKGFIRIGEVPIIERSINLLLRNGIERILIGTGYKSQFYESLGSRYQQIQCVKNKSYGYTGSFFTLYNIRKHIQNDFLLLESDLLYEDIAISFLQESTEKDIILASGWTRSGDEFYIEVDDGKNLVNMSKNKNDLNKTYGELVGISKLSYATFQSLCSWADSNIEIAYSTDYEYALSTVAQTIPIAIKKIDDLVWVEIDDGDHLERALSVVYPKIKEKESE
jgi:2-aminoethylphosphonate-pyruvate transaminase